MVLKSTRSKASGIVFLVSLVFTIWCLLHAETTSFPLTLCGAGICVFSWFIFLEYE